MYPQLFGDGLIAFSDPAGAKAGLALATILLKKDPTRSIQVFSNRNYAFYADWQVEVTITPTAPDTDARWLFTGTSHPETSDGFELAAIDAAKRRGVSSWAFVDHWTRLALRFECARRGRVFPDRVVVVDQLAAEKAISEGIPAELLIVHPNPYLEYIRDHWTSQLSRREVLETIGVGEPCKLFLLYAPDPLSLRNSDGAWAFNEGDVLLDLVAIAKERPGITLVVKAHPLQSDASWSRARAAAKEASVPLYFVTASIDPLELMQAADLIIGFHSNFLLEANVLGRPILRYFPANADRDAIDHLSVGSKITSRAELVAAIQSFGGQK